MLVLVAAGAVVVEAASAVVAAVVPGAVCVAVVRSWATRAAAVTSAAVSRWALVLGPGLPGGAPPGSGTLADGSDGSVVLTPGWLGPSQL